MVSFTRMTGKIGADVHGIDLSQELNAETAALVREALNDHQVLFFREQPILSVEQHKALAGKFGELEIAPFLHDVSDPTVMLLDQSNPSGSQAANFHADNTFRPHPPMGALLQAHSLPGAGGDTCFSSMHAAYEALSDRMKAYLDGLEAWHSLAQMAARLASQGLKSSLNMDDWSPIKHPVIAVHPETARKLLNVNYNWTTQIDGLPAAESRMLLDFLYEHIKSPEFQVRLHWHEGDIAFWDNRAVQHYAVPDWQGRRVMQRVAIAGGAG
jgi:taurine dioxygenase